MQKTWEAQVSKNVLMCTSNLLTLSSIFLYLWINVLSKYPNHYFELSWCKQKDGKNENICKKQSSNLSGEWSYSLQNSEDILLINESPRSSSVIEIDSYKKMIASNCELPISKYTSLNFGFN